MKREKITGILSLLAGLVFLVSGIAKSLGITSFVEVIAGYGVDAPYLAPLVVMLEVVIGLMLVFRIFEKYAALAGGITVAVFTLIYTYGYAFAGIEDCGCFGNIERLNTSPVFTFVRNAVLLVLLFFAWRGGSTKSNVNATALVISLGFVAVSAFMSGYSYRQAGGESFAVKHPRKLIKNTPLAGFVQTSKDSTYIIFAFSYTCPHCANSIDHLNRYRELGVADTVIGLAFEHPAAERAFRKHFKPSFAIKNVPAEELFELTNTFPKTWYIRNDSIISEIEGTLPHGALLRLE